MCGLMNINVDEVDEEESQEKREELERAHKIDAILEKMWKFNQTYKLSTEKLVITKLDMSIYFTYW